MIEHDDLLATMYDDDDDVANAMDAGAGITSAHAVTRKIRVGIIEYEVPTVEYVQQLERLLAQQTQMLHQQRRAIQRLETMLHGTRGFIRRYNDVIGELRLELTHKVDHS